MICLIIALIVIIYAAQILLYAVHMFQQNGYKNKVHAKWVLKNYGRHFTKSLSGKPSKKPLVFTPRVIRLLITTVCWFIIICIINRFFGNQYTLLAIAIVYAFAIAPFAPIVSNLINKPIEASISDGFKKRAMTSLGGMKDIKVIGVTGSYGKTSLKFFLKELLSSKFEVLATPESYNTPMGVTKTINEMLRPTHQIFICEMGARNVGDIKELCDMVHPDYGIVTSIGAQHLESFRSIENIQRTKFELPDSVYKKTKDASRIFLNMDSEYIASFNTYEGAVTYSSSGKGDYNASDIRTGRRGTEFTLTAPDGSSQKYTMRLIGAHNVINVVGAIALSHSLGISLEELVLPVRRLTPVEHRLSLIEQGDLTIIDDAYNSNPSGAKAALDTLGMFEEDLKIVVTPGMVELGEKQAELNEEFGAQIADIADFAVIVDNDNTDAIKKGIESKAYPSEKLYIASSFADAMEHVRKIPGNQHKVVLLENDLTDVF
ncbi:MAG: UDP-N-acetylmuramoyl-tripeptide--D-alanyl-D-alanine ligase [Lachnospiraceae bacterium]|nr:UDP-N-acetylmuramoyl-tripeptide--D-alanyl-D-alanine ligase [Lachnospiraceae bacterium]